MTKDRGGKVIGLVVFQGAVWLYFSLGIAWAGQDTLSAATSASAEYNDNIYVTRTDQVSDYILRISPLIFYKHQAAHWDCALSYRFTHELYTQHNLDSNYQYLDADANFTLVENYIFLNVQDTYHRVPLYSTPSMLWETNPRDEIDENIFILNPYILLHPGSTYKIKAGYIYRDVDYSDIVGIGREENGVAVEASHEMTAQISLLANFYYTQGRTSDDLDYTRTTADAGFSSEYAPKSYIRVRGGYTAFSFENERSRTSPYWDARINRVFNTINCELYSSVLYNEHLRYNSSETETTGFRVEKLMHRGQLSGFIQSVTVRDDLEDITIVKYLQTGAQFRYLLTPRAVWDLSLSEIAYQGDAFTGPAPVWRQFNTGLTVQLAHSMSLQTRYILSAYRGKSSDSVDAINANRVIITVTKQFDLLN